MANELQVVSAEVLSPEDIDELAKHIEATINAHKNNRQTINRLVFESVCVGNKRRKCYCAGSRSVLYVALCSFGTFARSSNQRL